jgi:hypothetical protein
MRALVACGRRQWTAGLRRVVRSADHHGRPVWVARASFARPSHAVATPDSDFATFDPFMRPYLPPATKLVNPVAQTVRAYAQSFAPRPSRANAPGRTVQSRHALRRQRSHAPACHSFPPQEPETVAAYTKMVDITQADLDLQTAAFTRAVCPETMVNRVIAMLTASRGCFIGNHVDMYEHNLQCGSRALHAGEPEETVVVALLHDIGEAITPNCHGEIAAGLLRPYISEENYWILMHHEIFQARYYGPVAGIEDVDGLSVCGFPAL